MECGGGTWVGFYTDTCLRSNCGNVTSGLAMIIIDDRDDNDLMMPHQLKTACLWRGRVSAHSHAYNHSISPHFAMASILCLTLAVFVPFVVTKCNIISNTNWYWYCLFEYDEIFSNHIFYFHFILFWRNNTFPHSCFTKLPRPGCPELCPELFSPVCGSDGKTYSNFCQLELVSMILR